MRTTIDKAGRVVIPALLRQRAGFIAGAQLEITEDETGLRIERIAAGSSVLVFKSTRVVRRRPLGHLRSTGFLPQTCFGLKQYWTTSIVSSR